MKTLMDNADLVRGFRREMRNWALLWRKQGAEFGPGHVLRCAVACRKMADLVAGKRRAA